MRFVEAVWTLFLKMCTTPSQNDGGAIRVVLLSCPWMAISRGRSLKNGLLRLFARCPHSFEGLKRATPVEDSAPRLQRGLAPAFAQGSHLRPLSRIRLFRSSAIQHGLQMLPRRPQRAPRCAQDAARATRAAPGTPPELPRCHKTSRRRPPFKTPHLQHHLQQRALKTTAPLEHSLPVHFSPHCDCRGRPSSMYMWSPHDIGRESWVWEEQEALWVVDSPPQGGGRSPR